MKSKLLFLNNTKKPAALPPALAEFLGSDLEVESVWAAGSDFPESLDGYAGAFVSGSPHSSYDDEPWIAREHAVIAELAHLGTPTLGICFGSQILASSLFGRDQVYRRAACEVGYKWLDVDPDAAADPVCGGLDRRIRMFVWHNDDVHADHDDMQVIATTDVCDNQIWRHRTRPIWGIQGHLEITAAEAPQWFGRNRERLEADGADVDRLIAEAEQAEVAKTMLHRFVDLCRPTDARPRSAVVAAQTGAR
nr:type 1 glutamine amidotransferase [Desulfuromonadales bacterium]